MGGSFPMDALVNWTAQLVVGIEYMHNLGYIHRDLKLENILLDEMNHIKITDFGLAKRVANLEPTDLDFTLQSEPMNTISKSPKNRTSESLQRTHTFCGTDDYLAPEMIKSQGYGNEVDWWSLGIIL